MFYFYRSADASSNNLHEDSSLFNGVDIDLKNLVKDWIPECLNSLKPKLGQRFSDLDQGYIFYKEYDRQSGFDVRRSTEKSDRFGNTITKYYVCSRSGRPEDKNLDENIKRRRTISTKCECHAELVLGIHDVGGFFVKKFTEVHNHPFAGKGGMQFLRYSRSLTEFHKRFIVDAPSSKSIRIVLYTIYVSNQYISFFNKICNDFKIHQLKQSGLHISGFLYISYIH